MKACMHDNLETVKYLIDRLGAQVGVTNRNDENCLIIAVRSKKLAVVQYLCQTQVKPKGELDVDYESQRNGLTAFTRACLQKCFDIADALLQLGKANKDYVNRLEGKTAIELAMEHKQRRSLEYLLSLDVDDSKLKEKFGVTKQQLTKQLHSKKGSRSNLTESVPSRYQGQETVSSSNDFRAPKKQFSIHFQKN